MEQAMTKRAEADGEVSVADILSAIRKRVSDETGARYARDTAIVRREMFVLRPAARIDLALAEADKPEITPTPTKTKSAKSGETTLDARILAVMIRELRKPDGALRAALRDVLNQELGGD